MISKQLFCIITLLLSLLPVNVYSNENTQYLLIKVDDYGNNTELEDWEFFFDYLEIYQMKVDLGVIGSYNGNISVAKTNNILEFIEKDIISVYNHGWDHKIPEFENRSMGAMSLNIEKWDDLMSLRGIIPQTKVLGAPGNAIGNRSNVYEPVYQALFENDYDILYFSNVDLNGKMGLDMSYCPAENLAQNIVQLDIFKKCIQNTNTQAIFTQIHPVYDTFWNFENLKLFHEIGISTNRVIINIDDYFNDIWLPNHPNYNPSLQIPLAAYFENMKQTTESMKSSEPIFPAKMFELVLFGVLIIIGLYIFNQKRKYDLK